VRDALYEDIGRQDWTGRLIPAGRRVQAIVRVRESAVLCGRDWFCSCISTLDPDARIHWLYNEGATMTADTEVCRIEANGRALISKAAPRLGDWPDAIDEAGCARLLREESAALAAGFDAWPAVWTWSREQGTRLLGAV
jgi:hypothetical protein